MKHDKLGDSNKRHLLSPSPRSRSQQDCFLQRAVKEDLDLIIHFEKSKPIPLKQRVRKDE